MARRVILPGVAVPWFTARCTANERFVFDTVAGRYIVLCLFGSAGNPASRQTLDQILALRQFFDDENICFFGVSADPQDETEKRVAQSLPGFRYFWDFDRAISRAYHVVDEGAEGIEYHPMTYVLDPRLRVLAALPFGDDAAKHAQQLTVVLQSLKRIPSAKPAEPQAPVLVAPRIFEPAFCRKLIDLYETHGGGDSGFMRDINGKTVGIVDHNFKRRRDYTIEEEEVRRMAMHRVHDRLATEIHRAFQFHVTRMERYIVSCYDAGTGGYFRPHRDNTTLGTAHRRFAVSINLNAEEFEGGDLCFPEFGRQTYRPSTGGAVVFSCSLLHEATPVTKGKRYAFLPFLYDDAAAKVREENLKFLEQNAPVAP